MNKALENVSALLSYVSGKNPLILRDDKLLHDNCLELLAFLRACGTRS